jgi:hypothetical protein
VEKLSYNAGHHNKNIKRRRPKTQNKKEELKKKEKGKRERNGNTQIKRRGREQIKTRRTLRTRTLEDRLKTMMP